MIYSAAHSIDELLVNKILTYRPSHPIKALIIEFHSQKLKCLGARFRKYLKQLFPDPEVRKFTMLCVAAILCTNDNEQKTIWWSGLNNALKGANGRSDIVNLLRSIRDADYYCTEDLYGALTSTDEPDSDDDDSDGPPPLANSQGEIIFE